MSSLTRTISRGIARKNGTLKSYSHGRPNYRGQIFKQHAPKKDVTDGMFARMYMAMVNAMLRRKAK